MPLSRLYLEYCNYCEEHEVVLPAVKSHMGASISKMFPQTIVRRRKSLGKSEVCYEGLSLHQADTCQAVQAITVPQYCNLRKEGDWVYLDIPTMFVCDNEQVEFNFKINSISGELQLKVNDVSICGGTYGFKTQMEINQRSINSLIYIYNCMCKGRILDVHLDSKSALQCKWKSVYEFYDYDVTRIHSNKCKSVLKINSATGTHYCENCRRDLNNAVKYYNKVRMHKQEESSDKELI